MCFCLCPRDKLWWYVLSSPRRRGIWEAHTYNKTSMFVFLLGRISPGPDEKQCHQPNKMHNVTQCIMMARNVKSRNTPLLTTKRSCLTIEYINNLNLANGRITSASSSLLISFIGQMRPSPWSALAFSRLQGKHKCDDQPNMQLQNCCASKPYNIANLNWNKNSYQA